MPGSAERQPQPIDVNDFRKQKSEKASLEMTPLREKFDELEARFIHNVPLWKRNLRKSLVLYRAGQNSENYNEFEYYRYKRDFDNDPDLGEPGLNADILAAEHGWEEYITLFQEERNQALPELADLKAEYSLVRPNKPPEVQKLEQYIEAISSLQPLDNYPVPDEAAIAIVDQFLEKLKEQPSKRAEMAG
jgi:hypothetical protein